MTKIEWSSTRESKHTNRPRTKTLSTQLAGNTELKNIPFTNNKKEHDLWHRDEKWHPSPTRMKWKGKKRMRVRLGGWNWHFCRKTYIVLFFSFLLYISPPFFCSLSSYREFSVVWFNLKIFTNNGAFFWLFKYLPHTTSKKNKRKTWFVFFFFNRFKNSLFVE